MGRRCEGPSVAAPSLLMVQTLTGQQRIARCLPTAGSPGLGQPLPRLPLRPGRARCTHPRKSHLYAAIPGLAPARPPSPPPGTVRALAIITQSTEGRQLIELKPHRARLVRVGDRRATVIPEWPSGGSFLFAAEHGIFFCPPCPSRFRPRHGAAHDKKMLARRLTLRAVRVRQLRRLAPVDERRRPAVLRRDQRGAPRRRHGATQPGPRRRTPPPRPPRQSPRTRPGRVRYCG